MEEIHEPDVNLFFQMYFICLKNKTFLHWLYLRPLKITLKLDTLLVSRGKQIFYQNFSLKINAICGDSDLMQSHTNNTIPHKESTDND